MNTKSNSKNKTNEINELAAADFHDFEQQLKEDAETSEETSKFSKAIKVYCTDEDFKVINEKARQNNYSASSYLRKVGLEHEVTSVLDAELIRDICNVNGDLGRLGGLFKLWLTYEDNPKYHFAEDFQQEGRQILKEIMLLKNKLEEHIVSLGEQVLN